MGRIADLAKQADESTEWTNKVDDILAELDDEDRDVVMSWLLDPSVADQEIEYRFADFDIACSDSTVRQWRRRRKVAKWAA